MIESPDVTLLTEEYETLVAEVGGTTKNGLSMKKLERIQQALITQGEWTPVAANELLHLATHYGTFMLRNACALAIALEIEDGEAGF